MHAACAAAQLPVQRIRQQHRPSDAVSARICGVLWSKASHLKSIDAMERSVVAPSATMAASIVVKKSIRVLQAYRESCPDGGYLLFHNEATARAAISQVLSRLPNLPTTTCPAYSGLQLSYSACSETAARSQDYSRPSLEGSRAARAAAASST